MRSFANNFIPFKTTIIRATHRYMASNAPHLKANELLARHPGRPIKAFCDALTDKALTGTDVAMEIVQNPLCGINCTSTLEDDLPYGFYDRLTPLMVATFERRPDVIRALLLAGADAEAVDQFMAYRALHIAAKNDDIESIEELLRGGANINALSMMSGTPLSLAAYQGHVKAVEMLLGKGADPNLRPETLKFACASGSLPCVEALVAFGADVSKSSGVGSAPLHWASFSGHAHIAKYLLSKSADVNAADDCGDTPLHRAAAKGFADVTELLIAHGANLEATNPRGCTPLHAAAGRGRTNTAKILLSKGANHEAVDELKRMPAQIAETWGYKDTVVLKAERSSLPAAIDYKRRLR
eukprot:GILI01013517.1.p1 GENE.GILI01013517.1~~GILI01013517.1.p1  ORF type:complete len:355 (-),score=45.07 GILI01013517.1:169-1233(-)